MLGRVRESLLKTGWSMGLYTPPDRAALDRILRVYAGRPSCRRVLFVGVKHYNRHIPAWFSGRSFATIDPNPAVARFGGEAHIVDVVEHLDRHAAPESLDLVVMNGVIGFGLNEPERVERALLQIFRALVPGGDLVLGVNERIATHVPLAGVRASALFRPKPFELYQTAKLVLATPFREQTHTFEFWEKPPGARDGAGDLR